MDYEEFKRTYGRMLRKPDMREFNPSDFLEAPQKEEKREFDEFHYRIHHPEFSGKNDSGKTEWDYIMHMIDGAVAQKKYFERKGRFFGE